MNFRFHDFELDDSRYAVRRLGRSAPGEAGAESVLPRRLGELLVYLVRNRDRAVPARELALLFGSDVEERVRELQRLLGERAARPLVVGAKGELRWTREPRVRSGSESVPPSQGLVVGRDAERFVGRGEALEQCRAWLGGEARPHPGLLFITGETGSGRSRLAREVSDRAFREHRFDVRFARCAESTGPPAWRAWRQIIEVELTTGASPDVPESLGDERVAQLAELAPGLRQRTEPTEGGPPRSLFAEREALAEAVSALLLDRPGREGLLLVLDDLDEADTQSMRLLSQLLAIARERCATPFAVLATCFPESIEPLEPPAPGADAALPEARRAGCLHALASEQPGPRIALAGLADPEAAGLAAQLTGAVASEERLRELMQRCAGNPGHLRALLRVEVLCGGLERARADGRAAAFDPTPTPPELFPPILRRLTRLSPDCRTVLELAAVVGRPSAPGLLARASSLTSERHQASLREALRSGILKPVPAPDAQTELELLTFVHPFVAEVLHAHLEPEQRAGLHQHVAAVLDTESDEYAATELGELARHVCLGAAAGDPRQAVEIALAAAVGARDDRDFPEEARCMEYALLALDVASDIEPRDRVTLLIELARARSRAGLREPATEAYRAASRLAREHQLVDLLAEAALGFAGQGRVLAGQHQERERLLDEALARLGGRDASLRVRLLSRLGALRTASGNPDSAETASQRALDVARATNAPEALAAALSTRVGVVATDPSLAEERLALSEEALELARELGDQALEWECRFHQLGAVLQIGDLERFDVDLADFAMDAQASQREQLRWTAEVALAMRCLLAGRFGDAEKCIFGARQRGLAMRHPDTEVFFGVQLTQLRFHQGRLAEMEEPFRAVADAQPRLVGLRAALALIHAETDRVDEAGRALEWLVRDRCARLESDAGWLSNLSLLALVANRVRDPEASAVLYDLLEPHAFRNVSVHLVACNGSVALFLGLLADAMGRHESAKLHLRDAVLLNQRMEAAPWVVHAGLHLARSLLASSAEDGESEAAQLLGDALLEARRLGMAEVQRQIEPLVAQLNREAGTG